MEKKTPEKRDSEQTRKESDQDIGLQMPQLSLIPKIRTSPKKMPSKKMTLGDELVAEIQESSDAARRIGYSRKDKSGSGEVEESKRKPTEQNFLE